jgi:hypothetical protein
MARDEFDVYKLVAQDTNQVNRRRQALDALYVTLLALILTGDGYVAVSSQLDSWLPTIVTAGIGIIGIFIARYWRHGLSDLRKILDVRYTFLRELETLPNLSSIMATVFTKEWEKIYRDREARHQSTTRGLSLIFIIVFILIPVVLACLTALFFIPGAKDLILPFIKPLTPPR